MKESDGELVKRSDTTPQDATTLAERTLANRKQKALAAEPLLLAGLRELATFLTVFEQPDFEWQEHVPDGGLIVTGKPIGYMAPAQELMDFEKAAYEHGVVMRDFNWPEWKATPEAEGLRDDPDRLARATPEQLAKLLTILIRQERFVEGSLAGAGRDGFIAAILRRAAALTHDSASEAR